MFQPSNIDPVADQDAKLLESVARCSGTINRTYVPSYDDHGGRSRSPYRCPVQSANLISSEAAWGDIITGVVALPMMRLAIMAGAWCTTAIAAWDLFGTADRVLAITLGVMPAEGSPLQVFHSAPGSEAMQRHDSLPLRIGETSMIDKRCSRSSFLLTIDRR
jgi:hypothetical protein